MASFRRYLHRYKRFRRKSLFHHGAFMATELAVATAFVYKFLAPVICR